MTDGDRQDERFHVIDLASWTPYRDEPAGDNPKSWFTEPVTGARWIFKPNRPNRSAAEGRSELIASLIAEKLTVPAARVRLARHANVEGCVSRNVLADETHELDMGALFVSELVEDFDRRAKDNRGHNLDNIARVLDQLAPPVGAPAGELTARDWFAGYLLFDALIGNRDRHSENWAVETDAHGVRHLAPSYDHASSLGVTVHHEGALARATASAESIRTFSHRATAGRFEGLERTSLVDAASLFLASCSPAAQPHWRARFTELDPGWCEDVIDHAGLSGGNRRLAGGMVRYNRERILACLA